MGMYYKTDEEKQRLSKIKEVRCKNFSEFLTSIRINHKVNNNGYHIQVQVQHNFYPSKGSYYNSESTKKFRYPKFKSGDDFLEFIGKNSK